MKNATYRFEVPNVGVVEVRAASMGDALFVLSDKVGIKFLSRTEIQPKRPALRLVARTQA